MPGVDLDRQECSQIEGTAIGACRRKQGQACVDCINAATARSA